MTIRRTPADFLVSERLAPRFEEELRPERTSGAHVVYTLTKTSMTTPDAAGQLARALGARGGQADYAGLKDKHARTTQHVSVPASALPQDPAALVEGRGWTAALRGWSPEALSADAIEGNSFEIVVRDLARETCSEMDRRASLLALPHAERGEARTLLVVNYFGDQRFGSARHGKGFVARALMDGDFEGALKLAIGVPARKDTGKTRVFTRLLASRWGDWIALADELPRCPERRAIEVLARGGSFRDAFAELPNFLQSMYVEAFQSHLWNATARILASRITADADPPQKPLRSDDTYGEMLFPPSAAATGAVRTMDVPLLARDTVLREPWKSAAEGALRDEGVTQDQLRVPGLRRPFFGEAPRTLFTLAERFTMSRPEPDELSSSKRVKRTVVFDLPRGSYATVVLRALGT